MKVLIIGGVAAGTKAAAKLRRENMDTDVTIITKGRDISYAGCGLPYYVGDIIKDRSELIVNSPESFAKLTGAHVVTGKEAISLNRAEKTVEAADTATGEKTIYTYDKLIIATGADVIKPRVEGLDLPEVYYMRTPDDAERLKKDAAEKGFKRVTVVGGGFIGLETAENLASVGIRVSVIDMAPHIMPGFDDEMATYVEDYLTDRGIMVFTEEKMTSVEGNGKVEKLKTEKRGFKSDAVVMSLGIRPNTAFLADSGIKMLKNGTIITDSHMLTNDADIYAAGDCATVSNIITNSRQWAPMGSSANMEGRVLARHIGSGCDEGFAGVAGTAVIKLLELNAAKTGLSEKSAIEAGYDAVSVIIVTDDKAHYYPGASTIIIKMIADKKSGKLLGVQAIGKGAVDKIVDIAVTALTLKASVYDLVNMDLAYAPPFSTAIHPFTTALNVLINKLEGRLESCKLSDIESLKDYKVMDVCLIPTLDGVQYVELSDINGPVDGYRPEDKILLVCNKGRRAYLTQSRLKHFGYMNTVVLEGGTIFNGKDNILNKVQ